MKWNARRLLAGIVLAAWAALFWFVLLSGRTGLYLSTRTAWLIPAGAGILTFATLGRLASSRSSDPPPVRRSDLRGGALLVMPVIVLLALPTSTLGTFALGRRPVFGPTAPSGGISSGTLSMVDVARAQATKEDLAALQRRAGETVVMQGFVAFQPGEQSGEFLLSRFIITCCVADATETQVRVVDVPAGSAQANAWVQVTGRIYPFGSQVIIDAMSVKPIPRPADPYLTG
ncbi:MAG: putative rane protein [Actinomycetota bacterium]|nr:putative rane protein [Actinomycetota bacterium]